MGARQSRRVRDGVARECLVRKGGLRGCGALERGMRTGGLRQAPQARQAGQRHGTAGTRGKPTDFSPRCDFVIPDKHGPCVRHFIP